MIVYFENTSFCLNVSIYNLHKIAFFFVCKFIMFYWCELLRIISLIHIDLIVLMLRI